jgi:hypothetical protein
MLYRYLRPGIGGGVSGSILPIISSPVNYTSINYQGLGQLNGNYGIITSGGASPGTLGGQTPYYSSFAVDSNGNLSTAANTSSSSVQFFSRNQAKYVTSSMNKVVVSPLNFYGVFWEPPAAYQSGGAQSSGQDIGDIARFLTPTNFNFSGVAGTASWTYNGTSGNSCYSSDGQYLMYTGLSNRTFANQDLVNFQKISGGGGVLEFVFVFLERDMLDYAQQ